MVSSAVSRINNSPIHFIKLTNYGKSVDSEGARELGRVLDEKVPKTELDRSIKGRRMLIFPERGNDEMLRQDKKISSFPNINIIPYGFDKKANEYSTNKNKISDKKVLKRPEKKTTKPDHKIFRPDLQFLSNARPAKLKWREMRIEKTPIIRPYKAYEASKAYKAYKAKYASAVPVHHGYSRAYLDPVSDKAPPGVLGDSSVTLLPSGRWNGQPQTILTFHYPVRERVLYRDRQYYF